MEGVAVDIMGGIEKLSKLFRCPRRICLVNGIYGLTRGQMVCRGSDAADPGDDSWKFLHRSSQTENFESSQFRDLKISVLDVPPVVQKNLDLAVSFQSRDRINRYRFHENLFFLNAEAGKPKR
jgi:hypothetical protein